MVELKMGRPAWWEVSPEKLEELKLALMEHAPRLRLSANAEMLTARGTYVLVSDGETLDTYAIEIQYDRQDPTAEPKVREIGNAIEPLRNNHINPEDKTCCVGVYGEWEALTGDTSFAGFLSGPMHNFFISQTIYRRTGKWIFDQRDHGIKGMVDAYGELLNDPAPTEERVGKTLSFLMLPSHKGHWTCPCGTGKRYRDCCRSRLSPSPLPREIAGKLLLRLQNEAVKIWGPKAVERLVYSKH